MKVIQIIPKMNIGGVERGVVDLAKYFKNSDLSNIIISGGGRLVSELRKSNITHYRLKVYEKSLLSLRLIPKLNKIIEKEKIDIIHARSRVPAWLSFISSRIKERCFITTAHGMYKSKLFSQVMGWGKFVICPSKAIARHMKEQYGVPQEKIVIISRWVDLDRFTFRDSSSRNSSNLIVSMGRIAPQKGYEYLIDAIKKISRFNPYIKLKIIGSPDPSKLSYFQSLKNLVGQSALGYNVEFSGFSENVPKILEQARILVAPSIGDEAFGRVLIEAFACGVPVIAADVCGYREVIDNGQDGLLVEPKNSQAIADNIIKLFSDSELVKRLTCKARKKVEVLYSMERSLKETKEVYELALTQKRILVIKISSFGDLILAIPSLKAIKDKFPQSRLSLLTHKKFASLFYGCPYLDEIITLSDNYKKTSKLIELTRNLRRKSFDYIIDLQNSRISHLIAFLSFSILTAGYSRRWGFLLKRIAKCQPHLNPLDSQETVLNLLGIPIKNKTLSFWDIAYDSKLNLPDCNLIGFNVSASSRWESKNWPVSSCRQLFEIIQRNLPSYKIVLLGEETAKKRAEELSHQFSKQVINLCGKTTLADLVSVIKQTKVFITADTASLHLAQSLNIPTIGLFGPTDPKRHAVNSQNLHIFFKTLKCSPCYKPKCTIKAGKTCMEEIPAQEVFTVMKNILK